MVAFCECDDVSEETEYFRKQSLAWSLQQAGMKYKDIVLMIKDDKDTIKRKNKQERVVMFEETLSDLNRSACGLFQDIETNHHAVKGKNGHKEEELFWEKMMFKARGKSDSLEEYWSHARCLRKKFEEELGTDFGQRKQTRTKKKNKAKNERRQTLFKKKPKQASTPLSSFLSQHKSI